MSGEVDTYGDQYDLRTFVRRVTSVTEPAMRVRQIRRHFTTVEAPVVAEHFQRVLVLAAKGDPPAAEIVLAAGSYVLEATRDDLLALEAVNLAARSHEHHGVSWFLLEPAAARTIEGVKVMRMRGRARSSGERKQLAAGWEPRMLEQLLADTDPMVISKLCANSRLQEPHVLTIVTRRPVRPEIILAVATHARWWAQTEVRYAIANNPYTPTGLTLRILPTLPSDRQDRLRFARGLHPAISLAGEYFRALREGTQASGPSPDLLAPLDS